MAPHDPRSELRRLQPSYGVVAVYPCGCWLAPEVARLLVPGTTGGEGVSNKMTCPGCDSHTSRIFDGPEW